MHYDVCSRATSGMLQPDVSGADFARGEFGTWPMQSDPAVPMVQSAYFPPALMCPGVVTPDTELEKAFALGNNQDITSIEICYKGGEVKRIDLAQSTMTI